jgi:hypothetical protein
MGGAVRYLNDRLGDSEKQIRRHGTCTKQSIQQTDHWLTASTPKLDTTTNTVTSANTITVVTMVTTSGMVTMVSLYLVLAHNMVRPNMIRRGARVWVEPIVGVAMWLLRR